MNPLVTLGLIVFFFTMLLGLMLAFLIKRLRAYTLVIRNPTNDNAYIDVKLMEEAFDKELGVTYWRNVWWQKKFSCEKPPKEAIDLNKKGRQHAECYWISDNEYAWIRDGGIKVEKVWKDKEGKTVDEGTEGSKPVMMIKKSDGGIVDTFEPFTKTQRADMLHQYRKAELFNKNKWTPEKIMAFSALIILGGIIIIALIFGADIYKERMISLQVQQQTAVQLNENAKVMADIQQNQMNIMKMIGVSNPEPQRSEVILTKDEEPPQ